MVPRRMLMLLYTGCGGDAGIWLQGFCVLGPVRWLGVARRRSSFELVSSLSGYF